jgi:hypothetical protein
MSNLRRVVLFGTVLAALAAAMLLPRPYYRATPASTNAAAPSVMLSGRGGQAAESTPPDEGLAEQPSASDHYFMQSRTTRFSPDRMQTLTFQIVDAAGRPVTRFKRTHEKLLHLIVVRHDLTGYQHVHPSLGTRGVWTVGLTLPKPGRYRAFADFATPQSAHTLSVDLVAAGRYTPSRLVSPAGIANVAGYTVTLEAQARVEGDVWVALLGFQVERNGRPVLDLEPYLGAKGHLVALRAGDLAYSHVHPQDQAGSPGHAHGSSSSAGSGNRIGFQARFPGSGHYRLFLQFQRGGHVHTAAFTFPVP